MFCHDMLHVPPVVIFEDGFNVDLESVEVGQVGH